jgi:hypothetical protein
VSGFPPYSNIPATNSCRTVLFVKPDGLLRAFRDLPAPKALAVSIARGVPDGNRNYVEAETGRNHEATATLVAA